MAYLRGIGDGSDPTAIIFNSTKYPGTCKPSDGYTLGVFKGLQRQLNRVLFAKGLKTVGVDGDIGPGTVLAIGQALGRTGLACTSVARDAVAFAASLKLQADALRAPASVPAPTPPRPSTLVSAATGVEILAPSSGIGGSIADAWTNLPPAGKLAGVVIAGGLGYYVYKRMR